MTVVSGMLTIRFDSDWHCGSGQARYAGFDRTIARDVDGLPFVPAKTVLGLWRDACEKAANGLDEGPHGAWNELVRRIFGSAGGDDPDVSRGRLYVEPARLPEPRRAHLRPHGAGDEHDSDGAHEAREGRDAFIEKRPPKFDEFGRLP